MSQSTVSRAERGRLDLVSIEQLDAVARVLRVSLYLEARWLDGDADRLVDRDHAALVELVVAMLRRLRWDVVLEYGFNHFGDRGSVDVLGWHGPTGALLIVEVKSRVTDLQATLSAFERKVRIVPGAVAKGPWLAASDPGSDPRHAGDDHEPGADHASQRDLRCDLPGADAGAARMAAGTCWRRRRDLVRFEYAWADS